MFEIEKKAAGTGFAQYAEVMQLSLTGFFVSAFFLSRTYNEVLFILIAICALLSYFSRREFGYKLQLVPVSLVLVTLVIMALLIGAIKVLVSV